MLALCEAKDIAAAEPPAARAVSVADAIRMVHVDNPNYGRGTVGNDDVAAFSPDGKQFVVVTHRGNLEHNAVDYQLLLVQTAQALRAPTPDILVSLASSSTRPAIDSIVWLDNRSIAFLGENPGESHQLYRIDCTSKRLKRLTESPTNLINFAFSADTKTFFFTAVKPQDNALTTQNFLVVDREDLNTLISGTRPDVVRGLDLFVIKPGSRRPLPLKVEGKLEGLSVPWPSPDGRYLAIQTIQSRSQIAPDWFDYQTVAQQTILSRKGLSAVNEYELVDLTSGSTQPLLDAPVGAWYSNLVWGDDSRSVVISGTNLPLDVPEASERAVRAANLFVAEVEIPGGRIVPITHQDAIVRHWHSRTNELLLKVTDHRSFSNFEEGPLLTFRRASGGWQQQDAVAVPDKGQNTIAIALEEDMNTPPRLWAKDLATGARVFLLDPNPQFASLKFGRVEEVKFKRADGHQMKVGIYCPSDFRSGTRYPLVIQTHGWTPDRFVIDGPDPNGMAAQPLASKGFVIAQMGDEFFSERDMSKAAMEEFEWAVDYLEKRGLIDSTRVGIVGFSATGPGVGYAIAHSKYHFGAAVLSDTADAGYFTYLSSSNLPGTKEWYETANGGLPFGAGIAAWLREAPEFSLDGVQTAMLLQPNSRHTVFGLWEWFVGLRRLGKPVEMVLMPEAGHVVTRPLDRIVSQDGAVDWFDFWLNGHEEGDATKAEQYRRWEQLCDRQVEQNPNQPAFCVRSKPH